MEYEYRVCVYTGEQFSGGEEPTFFKNLQITVDQEEYVVDCFSPVHGHYTREQSYNAAYVVNGDDTLDEVVQQVKTLQNWVEDHVYICFERYEEGQWSEYVADEYSDALAALNLLYKFQDAITETLN